MKPKNPFKRGTPEAEAWAEIDPDNLPRHIAVIMDGNGRWAKQRNKPRMAGHRAGVIATRRLVKACARMGLEYLTLYAFSLDNWKRPKSEIDYLMILLRQYVRRELDFMKRNNVRLRVIGRWRELPEEVARDIARTIEETCDNTGLQVVIALNYTGRAELVDAVREIIAQRRNGDYASLTEDDISRRLYAPDLPEPDLLIRTSGEQRVSNFLLWQLAYAEFWGTETFWPDFTAAELLQAVRDFQLRERRFGALSEGDESAPAPSSGRRATVRT